MWYLIGQWFVLECSCATLLRGVLFGAGDRITVRAAQSFYVSRGKNHGGFWGKSKLDEAFLLDVSDAILDLRTHDLIWEKTNDKMAMELASAALLSIGA